MEDLKILVGVDINRGKAIGDINRTLKSIQKDSGLHKLDLKVNNDTNFTQALNKFNAAYSKIGKLSEEQSKIISQNQEVFKNLDGTIRTVTNSVLKNGEIITKTKVIHDANKKAIQEEANLIAKLTENIKNQNKVDLDSIKILRNKADAIVGYNVRSSKGYSVKSVQLGSDGSTLIRSSETTNYKKEREDTLKLTQAKEDLRRKLVELAQTGQLSTSKLQELARGTNQSKSISELQKVIDKYNELKRVSQSLVQNQVNQYQAQKRITEQLTNVQNKAELQATNLIRRYGDRIDVTGLNNLVARLKQLSPSSTDALNNAKQLRHEIDLLGASAKESGSHAISFGKMFSTAMSRFPVWIAASTMFMGSIHQITNAITYIKQFDDAIVNLTKVVDLSNRQIQSMAQTSIDLGKELGKSSVDIMKAYAEFGRQFKTMGEIKDVSRSAVLASNVTTLSAEQAAKSLSSAMIAFNVAAKDSIKIVDSLNEVQNNYRISAEDLVDSLAKVGSYAKMAGSSLQSLEGATTAIVSATGISGNEAGTAIKGMISRLFRLGEDGVDDAGKSEELLKSLGIEIRKSATEFKSFDDILGLINERWSTWSSVTKQAVAQQIASQYHVSKFTALMDNFAIKIDATNTALNSQNSAINENAKYIESISGRWQTLLTTIQDKWHNSIDSDAIKGFVSGLTVLIDKFGNLKTILSLVATGFLIFKGAAILNFFKSFSVSLSLANLNIVKTQASLAGLTAAEISAMTAANGLKFAVRGLWGVMAANPLGLIATAVTLGITLFDLFGNSVDDTNEELQKLNESFREQEEELSSVTEYYKNNYEQIGKNKEIKDQLFEMQNKLIDTFGKEAAGIDLVNGKYEEQIQKLDHLSKANLEKKINENQIAINAVKETNYGYASFGETTKSKVGSIFGQEKDFKVISLKRDGEFTGVEEYYKRLVEMYEAISSSNKDALIKSKEMYQYFNKLPATHCGVGTAGFRRTAVSRARTPAESSPSRSILRPKSDQSPLAADWHQATRRR